MSLKHSLKWPDPILCSDFHPIWKDLIHFTILTRTATYQNLLGDNAIQDQMLNASYKAWVKNPAW